MYKTKRKAEEAAVDGKGGANFDTQQCISMQDAVASSSPERPSYTPPNASVHPMNYCPRPPYATFNPHQNRQIHSAEEEIDVEVNEEQENQVSQAEDILHVLEAARESQEEQEEDPESQIVSKPAAQLVPVQQNNGTSASTINTNSNHSNSILISGRLETRRSSDGNNVLYDPFSRKEVPKNLRLLPLMTDSSQKSAMSLTQENSESVYNRYLRPQADQTGEDTGASLPTSSPDKQEVVSDSQCNNTPDQSKAQNSIHTVSTTRTYHENDTGYMDFNFQQASTKDDNPTESQDEHAPTSVEEPVEGHDSEPEPETPAPVINPFANRGSVMTGQELFAQPSSDRRINGGSPTSSRPTPEMDPDCQASARPDASSPLTRLSQSLAHNETNSDKRQVRQERLPRNSLLRSLTTDAPIPPIGINPSGVQSFDSVLRKPTTSRDPRDNYISMKESQEERERKEREAKRERLGAHGELSDSGSESDILAEPAHIRKQKRNRKIDDKIARIELQNPISKKPASRSNSRPSSAKSAGKSTTKSTERIRQSSTISTKPITVPRSSEEEPSTSAPQVPASEPITVEVPSSTGRRRSIQEEYLAQCEGSDARDTQQDMVADSQGVPNLSNAIPSSPITTGEKIIPPSADTETDVEAKTQSQRLPDHSRRERSASTTQDVDDEMTGVAASGNKTPAHAEDPMSHQVPDTGTLTPNHRKKSVFSDGVGTTIPETSPALKRMSDIANISFGPSNDHDLDDLPGFSQDVVYNEAMGLPIHGDSPSPQEKRHRSPAAAVPSVRFGPTASSSLSSVQSVLEPPTPSAANLTKSTPHVTLVKNASRQVGRRLSEGQLAQHSNTTPNMKNPFQPQNVENGSVEAGNPLFKNTRHQSADNLTGFKDPLNAKANPLSAKVSESNSVREESSEPAAKRQQKTKSTFLRTKPRRSSMTEVNETPNITHTPRPGVPPSTSQDEFDEISNLTSPAKGRPKRIYGKKAKFAVDISPAPAKAIPEVHEEPDLPDSPSSPTASLRDSSPGLFIKETTNVEDTISVSTSSIHPKRNAKKKPDDIGEETLVPAASNPKRNAKTRSNHTIEEETPVPAVSTPRAKPARPVIEQPTLPVAPHVRSFSPSLSVKSVSTSSTVSKRNVKKGPNKIEETTPLPTSSRRGSTRKPPNRDGQKDDLLPTRSSKRKSTVAQSEGSDDPLLLSTPPRNPTPKRRKSIAHLFNEMAFAVSYVKADREKDEVVRLIKQNDGRILEDGFEPLFKLNRASSRSHGAIDDNDSSELILAESEENIGFVALIADEHSRKAKFIQALALGLPCISGTWIKHCVAKEEVLDWMPYLLCAGQSSFLGGAIKSRYLKPYNAVESALSDVINEREKLLEGKSVMVVTGKGKVEDERKAYVFLLRALGPKRLVVAQDVQSARKILVDAEKEGDEGGFAWLCIDGKKMKMTDADAAVFQDAVPSTQTGGRKRKRASVESEDVPSTAMPPAPKRIRVVTDEVIVQSLILGRVIEE